MLLNLFNQTDFQELVNGTDITKQIPGTQSSKTIFLNNITPYFFNILDDGSQIIATVPPLSFVIAPIHPGSTINTQNLQVTSEVDLPSSPATFNYTQYKIQYSLSPVEQPYKLTPLSVAITTNRDTVQVSNTVNTSFNGVAQPVEFTSTQDVTLIGAASNFSEENNATTAGNNYPANVQQWFTFVNDDATNAIQINFDGAVGNAGTMTIKPGETLNGMPRKFVTLYVKAVAGSPAFRAWGV